MEFDEQMRDNTSGFITVETLTRINGDLENKIHRVINGVDKKVDDLNRELKSVDIKVDSLKDVVIPIAIHLEHFVKNSEENQKKTNKILGEQVKEQRLTNGLMGDKIQSQDMEMIRMNNKIEDQAAKKNSRGLIIVALITAIPAIIVIFN